MIDESKFEFENPINIGELLKDGSHFNLKTDACSYTPEIFNDDDYGDDDDDEEATQKLFKPWEKSFDELRQLMTPAYPDGKIYKRITKEGVGEIVPANVRVKVDYNSYFERDVQAFDSTTLRRDLLTFTLGYGEVLEGVEAAVRTMKVSEEAQFLISYELMYGEHGCPARIHPKADVLMVAKLVKFDDVGDPSALENLSKEDQKKFPIIKTKVDEIRRHAKDCVLQKKYHDAIRFYRQAVTSLELCTLENDEQQKQQEEILAQLFTNLAVCFNKVDQPKQVCIVCRDLSRISNINKNGRALFNHGRALMKLSEYKQAKDCLSKALRLAPNDICIKQELKLLEETYDRVTKEEKSIWTKALGLRAEVEEQESKEVAEFKEMIKTSINEFIESGEDKLNLPDGLTKDELALIEIMINVDQLKIKVVTNHSNGKLHYNLVKL